MIGLKKFGQNFSTLDSSFCTGFDLIYYSLVIEIPNVDSSSFRFYIANLKKTTLQLVKSFSFQRQSDCSKSVFLIYKSIFLC